MDNVRIDFEKVSGIVNYIIQADTPDRTTMVQTLVEQGFTEEWVNGWIDQFATALCDFLGVEYNENQCYNWVKTQSNLGKSADDITEQLIGVLGNNLSTSNIVTIYKNDKLYKEFVPLNIARINLHDIMVTLENDILYVIFTYHNNEYKIPLQNTPLKYKQLFKAKCILCDQPIPDYLNDIDVSNVDLTDLIITFNLD